MERVLAGVGVVSGAVTGTLCWVKELEEVFAGLEEEFPGPEEVFA